MIRIHINRRPPESCLDVLARRDRGLRRLKWVGFWCVAFIVLVDVANWWYFSYLTEWFFPAQMRFVFWRFLLAGVGILAADMGLVLLLLAYRTRRLLDRTADEELAAMEVSGGLSQSMKGRVARARQRRHAV